MTQPEILVKIFGALNHASGDDGADFEYRALMAQIIQKPPVPSKLPTPDLTITLRARFVPKY